MSFSTDPRSQAADDDGDRATRRALLLFAASLVIIGLGGLVAVTVKRDDRSSASTAASSVPKAKSAADALAATGLGPQPGDDLVAYTADRGAALAAATGDRAAVVSFSGYQSEAQVRALAGQVTVTGLLAAVPGGKPAVVGGSVADWLNSQLADQRAERDEFQRLLPTVEGDNVFKDFYRQEIDRLSKLIDAIKPDGPLVYAAVVRGPAPALQALGKATGVRLADVAPVADLKAGTPVRGVRPEETAKADDPPVRPV